MTAQQHFEAYVRNVYKSDLSELPVVQRMQLQMAFFSGITAATSHAQQLFDDVIAWTQSQTDRQVH